VLIAIYLQLIYPKFKMDDQNPISGAQQTPPQQNVPQANIVSQGPQPVVIQSQYQNLIQPTVVQSIVDTQIQPAVTAFGNLPSNSPLTNGLPKKGSKFQIIGGILVALGIFGIAGLLVNTLLKALLGNPPANTTRMTIVNIGTLSTTGLCLLVGIIFVAIGTIRQLKYTKATKH
jgi:hypothetical protein